MEPRFQVRSLWSLQSCSAMEPLVSTYPVSGAYTYSQRLVWSFTKGPRCVISFAKFFSGFVFSASSHSRAHVRCSPGVRQNLIRNGSTRWSTKCKTRSLAHIRSCTNTPLHKAPLVDIKYCLLSSPLPCLRNRNVNHLCFKMLLSLILT